MVYTSKNLRDCIIQRVREIGKPITYGQVNQFFDSYYDLSQSIQRHRFGEDLGDVSEFENSQGRPLLSAFVVQKENGMPGNGFFEMAERLQLYDPSKTSKRKFLKQEQEKVREYWKTHSD